MPEFGGECEDGRGDDCVGEQRVHYLLLLRNHRLTVVRSGDIVLMHHEKIKLSKNAKSSIRNATNGFGDHSSAVHGAYEPSAFLYTPKDGRSGHKDVVRCMYHDIQVRRVPLAWRQR